MIDGSQSSEAQQIAKRAELVIHSLLEGLFEAEAQDNSICLGELTSGRELLQVQLIVTRNPADFFDADYVMGDDE